MKEGKNSIQEKSVRKVKRILQEEIYYNLKNITYQYGRS